MALPIKKILDKVLEPESDWKINLLKNWNDIVGSLQTRTRLERIQDDILIIGVYESHWMQELFLLSRVIIKTINNFLGAQRIKNLKFKLVEEKKKSRKIIKSTSIPLREIRLNYEQKKSLEKITDDQLRLSMHNFLIRCLSSK